MENMKVEVTDKLLKYVEEFGNRYDVVDLFGRQYIKVYGDTYRDLTRFKTGWLVEGNSDIMLDYCNISSQGFWHVSQVMNFNELDMSTKRHIFEMNG